MMFMICIHQNTLRFKMFIYNYINHSLTHRWMNKI